MPQLNTAPALALLDDLMFTVKILDAAKRAGLAIKFLKSSDALLQKAGEAAPPLIILDLNYASADPVGLIRRLKAEESSRNIPLLAYVSHVQVDLKQAGEEAGCDRVLPRSAFVADLPGLLKQHA